jgi:hypothetical protein
MDEVSNGYASSLELTPLYIPHGLVGRHVDGGRAQYARFTSENIPSQQTLIEISLGDSHIGQIKFQRGGQLHGKCSYTQDLNPRAPCPLYR